MIPNIWITVGIIGQLIFAGRFFVQWVASERRKESHIPLMFWYLSLAGSVILLVYALYRKDPVFILGQSTGFFIYIRNLMLIHKKHFESRVSPVRGVA